MHIKYKDYYQNEVGKTLQLNYIEFIFIPQMINKIPFCRD
jgi:hypothetical protein